MYPRPVDKSTTPLIIIDPTILDNLNVRAVAPWLLHRDRWMLADPVFIIVDHDEVARTAEKHGSGDSSLFHNALGYINNNKVII